MVISNPVKFHQDILNHSQVTERTLDVADRQTDRQTWAKSICLRLLKGRHNN